MEQVIVPVFVFAVLGVIGLSFSPVARALARRISGDTPALEGGRRADAAEMDALRGDVGELRRELDDVQNRLDFTERMLAQARERGQLKAPEARA